MISKTQFLTSLLVVSYMVYTYSIVAYLRSDQSKLIGIANLTLGSFLIFITISSLSFGTSIFSLLYFCFSTCYFVWKSSNREVPTI